MQKKETDAAEIEEREATVVPGADLAEKALALMHAGGGEEVPSDLMVQVLKARMCHTDCVEDGWVLDGYPREKKHAMAFLEAGILLSKIVVLDVDDQVILDKQIHRRVDPENQNFYDVRDKGIADDLHQSLAIRVCDEEDVVKKKLSDYKEKTADMLSAFDPALILRISGPEDTWMSQLEAGIA